MVAVEFQADVDDGRIEIPDQYRAQIGRHVRVILLAGGPAPTSAAGAFDKLFTAAPPIDGFRPLSRDEAHERR